MEEREKREEAARDFDAVLRARVAANSLAPRVRSYLEPGGEESETPPEQEGEQE